MMMMMMMCVSVSFIRAGEGFGEKNSVDHPV